MYEFNFPDIGEGITEGRLVRWLIKPGDVIKHDQSIAVIETDKASVEIPSPVDGKISQLMYKEHDTVVVGKPLVLIENTSGPTTAKIKPAYSEMNLSKPDAEVKPVRSATDDISHQNKINYDVNNISNKIQAMPYVRKYALDHNIDMASISPTGFHGEFTMNDVTANQGRNILSNNIPANHQDYKSAVIGNHPQNLLATPSTRKLARDLNIDISKISGSGQNGMILKEDILCSSRIVDPHLHSDQDTIINMSPTRLAIAKHLSEAKNHAVQVTVSDEADLTELVRLKEDFAKKNPDAKIGLMPIFVKACVLALKKHPYINASLDETNSTIIIKHDYNIGIAVDTDYGLIVPVVKDAGSATFLEVTSHITELIVKAREKKLSINDMSGGTFTISNIGSIYGQAFSPVLNYPECGILGIGRIIDKPVVRDGIVAIRKMCVLSLTFDHRIIDGAEASRFLKQVAEYFENPSWMIIDMK